MAEESSIIIQSICYLLKEQKMPGSREKIFKEVMHFHYMTYGHAQAQEPLPRGS